MLNLSRTSYRSFILICLLFVACREKEGGEIFASPKREKQELIMKGYKNARFKTEDRTITLDNIFYKTINDTIIRYVFQNNLLERIEIELKTENKDSSVLFDAFRKKGLVKTSPIDTMAKAAFVEPSKKIHYDLYIAKSHITFVHSFIKPHILPPTYDSAAPKRSQ